MKVSSLLVIFCMVILTVHADININVADVGLGNRQDNIFFGQLTFSGGALVPGGQRLASGSQSDFTKCDWSYWFLDANTEFAEYLDIDYLNVRIAYFRTVGSVTDSQYEADLVVKYYPDATGIDDILLRDLPWLDDGGNNVDYRLDVEETRTDASIAEPDNTDFLEIPPCELKTSGVYVFGFRYQSGDGPSVDGEHETEYQLEVRHRRPWGECSFDPRSNSLAISCDNTEALTSLNAFPIADSGTAPDGTTPLKYEVSYLHQTRPDRAAAPYSFFNSDDELIPSNHDDQDSYLEYRYFSFNWDESLFSPGTSVRFNVSNVVVGTYNFVAVCDECDPGQAPYILQQLTGSNDDVRMYVNYGEAPVPLLFSPSFPQTPSPQACVWNNDADLDAQPCATEDDEFQDCNCIADDNDNCDPDYVDHIDNDERYDYSTYHCNFHVRPCSFRYNLPKSGPLPDTVDGTGSSFIIALWLGQSNAGDEDDADDDVVRAVNFRLSAEIIIPEVQQLEVGGVSLAGYAPLSSISQTYNRFYQQSQRWTHFFFDIEPAEAEVNNLYIVMDNVGTEELHLQVRGPVSQRIPDFTLGNRDADGANWLECSDDSDCRPDTWSCTGCNACTIRIDSCRLIAGRYYATVAEDSEEDVPIKFHISAELEPVPDAVSIAAGVPVHGQVLEHHTNYYVLPVGDRPQQYLYTELFLDYSHSSGIKLELLLDDGSLLLNESPLPGTCGQKPHHSCETIVDVDDEGSDAYERTCYIMVDACDLQETTNVYIAVSGQAGFSVDGDSDSTGWKVNEPLHYTLWGSFEGVEELNNNQTYVDAVRQNQYNHYKITAENVAPGSWLDVQFDNVQLQAVRGEDDDEPQFNAFVNYGAMAGQCPCYSSMFNCTGSLVEPDSCRGTDNDEVCWPDRRRDRPAMSSNDHGPYTWDLELIDFSLSPNFNNLIDDIYGCCKITVDACTFRSGEWYFSILAYQDDEEVYLDSAYANHRDSSWDEDFETWEQENWRALGYTVTAIIHPAPPVFKIVLGTPHIDWVSHDNHNHYLLTENDWSADENLVVRLSWAQDECGRVDWGEEQNNFPNNEFPTFNNQDQYAPWFVQGDSDYEQDRLELRLASDNLALQECYDRPWSCSASRDTQSYCTLVIPACSHGEFNNIFLSVRGLFGERNQPYRAQFTLEVSKEEETLQHLSFGEPMYGSLLADRYNHYALVPPTGGTQRLDIDLYYNMDRTNYVHFEGDEDDTDAKGHLNRPQFNFQVGNLAGNGRGCKECYSAEMICWLPFACHWSFDPSYITDLTAGEPNPVFYFSVYVPPRDWYDLPTEYTLTASVHDHVRVVHHDLVGADHENRFRDTIWPNSSEDESDHEIPEFPSEHPNQGVFGEGIIPPYGNVLLSRFEHQEIMPFQKHYRYDLEDPAERGPADYLRIRIEDIAGGNLQVSFNGNGPAGLYPHYDLEYLRFCGNEDDAGCDNNQDDLDECAVCQLFLAPCEYAANPDLRSIFFTVVSQGSFQDNDDSASDAYFAINYMVEVILYSNPVIAVTPSDLITSGATAPQVIGADIQTPFYLRNDFILHPDLSDGRGDDWVFRTIIDWNPALELEPQQIGRGAWNHYSIDVSNIGNSAVFLAIDNVIPNSCEGVGGNIEVWYHRRFPTVPIFIQHWDDEEDDCDRPPTDYEEIGGWDSSLRKCALGDSDSRGNYKLFEVDEGEFAYGYIPRCWYRGESSFIISITSDHHFEPEFPGTTNDFDEEDFDRGFPTTTYDAKFFLQTPYDLPEETGSLDENLADREFFHPFRQVHEYRISGVTADDNTAIQVVFENSQDGTYIILFNAGSPARRDDYERNTGHSSWDPDCACRSWTDCIEQRTGIPGDYANSQFNGIPQDGYVTGSATDMTFQILPCALLQNPGQDWYITIYIEDESDSFDTRVRSSSANQYNFDNSTVPLYELYWRQLSIDTTVDSSDFASGVADQQEFPDGASLPFTLVADSSEGTDQYAFWSFTLPEFQQNERGSNATHLIPDTDYTSFIVEVTELSADAAVFIYAWDPASPITLPPLDDDWNDNTRVNKNRYTQNGCECIPSNFYTTSRTATDSAAFFASPCCTTPGQTYLIAVRMVLAFDIIEDTPTFPELDFRFRARVISMFEFNTPEIRGNNQLVFEVDSADFSLSPDATYFVEPNTPWLAGESTSQARTSGTTSGVEPENYHHYVTQISTSQFHDSSVSPALRHSLVFSLIRDRDVDGDPVDVEAWDEGVLRLMVRRGRLAGYDTVADQVYHAGLSNPSERHDSTCFSWDYTCTLDNDDHDVCQITIPSHELGEDHYYFSVYNQDFYNFYDRLDVDESIRYFKGYELRVHWRAESDSATRVHSLTGDSACNDVDPAVQKFGNADTIQSCIAYEVVQPASPLPYSLIDLDGYSEAASTGVGSSNTFLYYYFTVTADDLDSGSCALPGSCRWEKYLEVTVDNNVIGDTDYPTGRPDTITDRISGTVSPTSTVVWSVVAPQHRILNGNPNQISIPRNLHLQTPSNDAGEGDRDFVLVQRGQITTAATEVDTMTFTHCPTDNNELLREGTYYITFRYSSTVDFNWYARLRHGDAEGLTFTDISTPYQGEIRGRVASTSISFSDTELQTFEDDFDDLPRGLILFDLTADDIDGDFRNSYLQVTVDTIWDDNDDSRELIHYDLVRLYDCKEYADTDDDDTDKYNPVAFDDQTGRWNIIRERMNLRGNHLGTCSLGVGRYAIQWNVRSAPAFSSTVDIEVRIRVAEQVTLTPGVPVRSAIWNGQVQVYEIVHTDALLSAPINVNMRTLGFSGSSCGNLRMDILWGTTPGWVNSDDAGTCEDCSFASADITDGEEFAGVLMEASCKIQAQHDVGADSATYYVAVSATSQTHRTENTLDTPVPYQITAEAEGTDFAASTKRSLGRCSEFGEGEVASPCPWQAESADFAPSQLYWDLERVSHLTTWILHTQETSPTGWTIYWSRNYPVSWDRLFSCNEGNDAGSFSSSEYTLGGGCFHDEDDADSLDWVGPHRLYVAVYIDNDDDGEWYTAEQVDAWFDIGLEQYELEAPPIRAGQIYHGSVHDDGEENQQEYQYYRFDESVWDQLQTPNGQLAIRWHSVSGSDVEFEIYYFDDDDDNEDADPGCRFRTSNSITIDGDSDFPRTVFYFGWDEDDCCQTPAYLKVWTDGDDGDCEIDDSDDTDCHNVDFSFELLTAVEVHPVSVAGLIDGEVRAVRPTYRNMLLQHTEENDGRSFLNFRLDPPSKPAIPYVQDGTYEAQVLHIRSSFTSFEEEEGTVDDDEGHEIDWTLYVNDGHIAHEGCNEDSVEFDDCTGDDSENGSCEGDLDRSHLWTACHYTDYYTSVLAELTDDCDEEDTKECRDNYILDDVIPVSMEAELMSVSVTDVTSRLMTDRSITVTGSGDGVTYYSFRITSAVSALELETAILHIAQADGSSDCADVEAHLNVNEFVDASDCNVGNAFGTHCLTGYNTYYLRLKHNEDISVVITLQDGSQRVNLNEISEVITVDDVVPQTAVLTTHFFFEVTEADLAENGADSFIRVEFVDLEGPSVGLFSSIGAHIDYNRRPICSGNYLAELDFIMHTNFYDNGSPSGPVIGRSDLRTSTEYPEEQGGFQSQQLVVSHCVTEPGNYHVFVWAEVATCEESPIRFRVHPLIDHNGIEERTFDLSSGSAELVGALINTHPSDSAFDFYTFTGISTGGRAVGQIRLRDVIDGRLQLHVSPNGFPLNINNNNEGNNFFTNGPEGDLRAYHHYTDRTIDNNDFQVECPTEQRWDTNNDRADNWEYPQQELWTVNHNCGSTRAAFDCEWSVTDIWYAAVSKYNTFDDTDYFSYYHGITYTIEAKQQDDWTLITDTTAEESFSLQSSSAGNLFPNTRRNGGALPGNFDTFWYRIADVSSSSISLRVHTTASSPSQPGDGVWVTVRDAPCNDYSYFNRIWCEPRFDGFGCEIQLPRRHDLPFRSGSVCDDSTGDNLFVTVEGRQGSFSLELVRGLDNCVDVDSVLSSTSMCLGYGLHSWGAADEQQFDVQQFDDHAGCLYRYLRNKFYDPRHNEDDDDDGCLNNYCAPFITASCEAALRAWACQETFRTCDSDGFIQQAPRSSCHDVEEKCGITFESADRGHYGCSTNRYRD